MKDNLLSDAEYELSLARKYSLEGFPGKSRVSARRAAAAAIRAYYRVQSKYTSTENAYVLLLQFSANSELPTEITSACQTLTIRVDHKFQLPPGLDPIQAADTIIVWISELLKESE